MVKRKSISKRLRFKIFNRDGFTCQYCGMSAPDVILELDHSLAHSKGGLDTEKNLITACVDCNRGKGADNLIAKGHALVGMAFHCFKGGKLDKQGAIERVFSDNAEVVYFSWITGHDNGFGSISLKDLAGPHYRLYASDLEMQRAFDRMDDPFGLALAIPRKGY